MSQQKPFDKYWSLKAEQLKITQPEVFLSQALKHGYLPKSGTLPGLLVSDIDPTNYKRIVIEYSKNKDGQKRIDYNPPVTKVVEFAHIDDSGYRVYSLIHPYSYWLLCKEIADNLPRITRILTEHRKIVSYSLPDFLNLKFRKEQGIESWLRMAEQDLLAESGEYKFLLKSDISSFYSSVYTHSISWAIHGKTKAQNKKNHNNWRLLGNRLDKLARNCNSAQTNGLPIGPVTSDILSELVLASVDKDIASRLKKCKIDFRAARYKDDYRFLIKTSEDARVIRKILAETLHEYGLTINERKTKLYSDIVSNYRREWKYSLAQAGLEIMNPKDFSDVSLYIDKIYKLQVGDDNYQPALSLMQELYKSVYEAQLTDKFEVAEIQKISAQLAHTYRLLPASLPVSIQLLDLLMGDQDEDTKKDVIDSFVRHFGMISDDGMLAWFYGFYLRLSKNHADDFLESTPGTSNMHKLLSGEWVFEDISNKSSFKSDTVEFVTEKSVLDFQTKPIDVSLGYSVSSPAEDFRDEQEIDFSDRNELNE